MALISTIGLKRFFLLCFFIAVVTLANASNVPTVTFTNVKQLSCNSSNDASVTFNLSGGTGQYTVKTYFHVKGQIDLGPTTFPFAAGSLSITGIHAETICVVIIDGNGAKDSACATIFDHPALTINSEKNVVCGGTKGSVNFTLSGGSGLYSLAMYLGGQHLRDTSLAAGNFTLALTGGSYCFAMTDQVTGCKDSACFTIAPLPTIQIEDFVNGDGTNGSVNLVLSGGTGHYTVKIYFHVGEHILGEQPTITSFAAGTLPFTGLHTGRTCVTIIDGNGCMDSVCFTVLVPVKVQITEFDKAQCSGDQTRVTLNISGGSALNNFKEYFNGVFISGSSVQDGNLFMFPALSGRFCVVVTADNGAKDSLCFDVTIPVALSVADSSIINAGCNTGGSIKITMAGGTTTYSYSWSNSASTDSIGGLTAGDYIVTVTDANNCSLVQTFHVGETKPSVDTISISICAGDFYVVGSSFYTKTGSYNTTLTNANGCDSIVTLNLTVNPPTQSVTTVSICQGGTFHFHGTTYSKSGIDTADISTRKGCDSLAILHLIVNEPTQSVTVAAICDGSSYLFNGANHTEAGRDTIYLVNSKNCDSLAILDLSINEPTQSVTVATVCDGSSYLFNGANYTEAGTDTIYLVNSKNCDSLAILQLTINEPTQSVTIATVCDGSSYLFNGVNYAEAGRDTIYFVNSKNCDSLAILQLTINEPTQSVTIAAICQDGSYLFNGTNYTKEGTDTVYFVNSKNCDSLAILQLKVNSLPIANAGNGATICNGNNITIGIPAVDGDTYSWSSNPAGFTSSSANPSVSPTANTTYTLIEAITATGCSASNSIAINVNPLPVVSVNNAATCGGSSATLNANGATTYTWSPSTGLSATTGSTVTANPTATTTYTITGTTGNCSNTTNDTVTVTPLPTISVSAPAPICNGSSTTLTASGATTYKWAPSTGLSATTGSIVSANPTITTTYTITGSNGNCTTTKSVVVAVNPSPVTKVTTPAPICGSGSVLITATGATTYTWSPSTGLSATSGAIIIARPKTTTTYTVTGKNNIGCTNATTVIVTVNPIPVIVVTTPAAVCSGSNSTLTASGASTYTWTPSTGLNNTTGATVVSNPKTTIKYIITGSSNGCTNSTSVTVAINPLPVIKVTTPAQICSGSSTPLTAFGGNSYTWSPATGLNKTSGTQTIASPVASITYTVTGTRNNGCHNSATAAINVLPVPLITITPSVASKCPDQDLQLTASGAASYMWSPSTGLNKNNRSTVSSTVENNTTYTVTGTSSNGCNGTKSVAISIISCPAPTGLTSTISSNSRANLNWSGSSCAIGYKLQYKLHSSKVWTTVNINSNTPSYLLSGLAKSSLYDWAVTTQCGNDNNSDDYSAISPTANFTTALSNSRIDEEDDTPLTGNEIVLYPNPTSNSAVIEFTIDETSVELRLMNILGQTVYSKTLEPLSSSNYHTSLNISQLPAGMYLVVIKTASKELTCKMIKQD